MVAEGSGGGCRGGEMMCAMDVGKWGVCCCGGNGICKVVAADS